jgi:hypothetical protein
MPRHPLSLSLSVCEFLYLQVFVFITPRVKAFNSKAVFVFGLMGFVGLHSSWVAFKKGEHFLCYTLFMETKTEKVAFFCLDVQ